VLSLTAALSFRILRSTQHKIGHFGNVPQAKPVFLEHSIEHVCYKLDAAPTNSVKAVKTLCYLLANTSLPLRTKVEMRVIHDKAVLG